MKEGTRIDESTPFDDKPQLRDPYSESKIRADELVSAFAKKSGLPTVILREGIIFGPGRQLPAGLFAFRLGNHRRRLRQAAESLAPELRREPDRLDAGGGDVRVRVYASTTCLMTTR